MTQLTESAFIFYPMEPIIWCVILKLHLFNIATPVLFIQYLYRTYFLNPKSEHMNREEAV